VRQDRQVLICPDCRQSHPWDRDLDRCDTCDSTRLVCRLGEVECRDCGQVRSVEPGAVGTVPGPDTDRLVTSGGSSLPDEVAEALDRVLKRRRYR